MDFHIWPKWVHVKIREYARVNKPSEISRKMLEKHNVSIRADRISKKLKNFEI